MSSYFISNRPPKHVQRINRKKTIRTSGVMDKEMEQALRVANFFADSVVNVVERPFVKDRKHDKIAKQESDIVYLTANSKYNHGNLDAVVEQPIRKPSVNQRKWHNDYKVEAQLNPTMEYLWDATPFTSFERAKKSLQPEINESLLDYMDFEDVNDNDNSDDDDDF